MLSKNTFRDKRPPITAHNTDKKGNKYNFKLFFSEFICGLLVLGLDFLIRRKKSEVDTIIIPIQDLIAKFSLINISPDNAANKGEIVSMERVFLVPIIRNEFI